MLKHLDLFSGIGGFSLAAKWVGGIETTAFCEIEPYAQRVLKKNFPGVPIYEDIRKLDGSKFKGTDILTGGFPCQPYSIGGGNSWAQKTPATCGRKCSESLKNQTPVGYLLKTLLTCSVWFSEKSKLTWRESVTKSGNHLSFRLVPSTPTKDGNGLGFVPTPARVDYKGAVKKRFRGSPHYRSNLPEFLRLKESDGPYPNPNFYEALMGYPEGWTELKD